MQTVQIYIEGHHH